MTVESSFVLAAEGLSTLATLENDDVRARVGRVVLAVGALLLACCGVGFAVSLTDFMRIGQTSTRFGLGFGTALAITISWSANKSILWAIIHGFLSWLYVIYYAIKYQ